MRFASSYDNVCVCKHARRGRGGLGGQPGFMGWVGDDYGPVANTVFLLQLQQQCNCYNKTLYNTPVTHDTIEIYIDQRLYLHCAVLVPYYQCTEYTQSQTELNRANWAASFRCATGWGLKHRTGSPLGPSYSGLKAGRKPF